LELNRINYFLGNRAKTLPCDTIKQVKNGEMWKQRIKEEMI
jgi:hypothetical protein